MLELKKKNVLNSYNCFCLSYCEASTLLTYQSKIGYTAGVYGWNADIYVFDNVALVTGYRPFGQRINSELTTKYEEKARKIVDNYELSYQQKEKKVNKLLEKFIEEVKGV